MSPQILGASFVAATVCADPVGAALMLSLGAPWVAWTLANVIVSATGGASPLIAAGPVVTGTGGLIVGPPQPLGLLLAATLGTVDPGGLASWPKVAAHYTAKLRNEGGIFLTTGLVAWVSPIPPVGAVSGVGVGIGLASPFDFAGALEITDPAAAAKWTAIGAMLEIHLKLVLVTPAMTNVFTGGPVLGVGTIA